jgi:nucleotide-binding universal stress UspA family protein
MTSAERRPVVVGVDGSPGTARAVMWAAAEAAARRVPLRLVTVFGWPPDYGPLAMYVELPAQDQSDIRRDVEPALARAAALASATRPGIEVITATVEGHRVPRLLAESAAASVLVLGSRQLHTAGAVLLGSVGAGVAARAECPVVVVRGPAGEPYEGAVAVAGVDGDPTSQEVLRYAFEHAARHGVRLRAVLCWHPHPARAAHWLRGPYADARGRAQAWLSEALAGWQEKYPQVAVRGVVIDDHPAAGLVAEGHGAHLLVVGAHGRHALAGTLLGSASQGVLHHATCPVAVIPAGR